MGSLETFVRHWWIAQYNYTSKDNVYKHFKKLWNNDEIDPKAFLEELVNDAALYIKLSSPLAEDFKKQEEQNLHKSLAALKNFNVSQQRPFILSLFKSWGRKNLTLSDVKSILGFVEKFHFSFNAICSMRPSGIEGSYSTAARQLIDASEKEDARKVIEELRQKLKSRLPNKDKFREGFSKLKYLKNYSKDKKTIQYIFGYFESVSQEASEFRPDSITLEHILSQASSTEDYVGAIGNLLPLGKELNEQAGDKQLSEKIKCYKKSQFSLTRKFTERNPSKWGKEEICNRTDELAQECYDSMWGDS